jgi:D-threo-aldose 1-dehydrogenase
MDPKEIRTIGQTGVAVTQLGLGGAAMGDLFVKVPEGDAIATVGSAWDQGIRFFDTAPWYGRGLSELRMGAGLRGRPRSEFTLSTKVGRWLSPSPDPDYHDDVWIGGCPNEVVFDYTYDGIMRAVDQSRLRLGISRFDIAVIHDLDLRNHPVAFKLEGYLMQLATSGWRALSELKTSGEIRVIAAGVNLRGTITRFLDIVDVDAFLVAMPYTLLHQEVLDDEFPAAVERGCGFIIGAPFQSGILATGAVDNAMYNYAPAPPEVLERVRRVEKVCERHSVSLAAAALQFPLGHPAVAAVIPGAHHPDHVLQNVKTFQEPIPADLWADLKEERLLREDALVPT